MTGENFTSRLDSLVDEDLDWRMNALLAGAKMKFDLMSGWCFDVERDDKGVIVRMGEVPRAEEEGELWFNKVVSYFGDLEKKNLLNIGGRHTNLEARIVTGGYSGYSEPKKIFLGGERELHLVNQDKGAFFKPGDLCLSSKFGSCRSIFSKNKNERYFLHASANREVFFEKMSELGDSEEFIIISRWPELAAEDLIKEYNFDPKKILLGKISENFQKLFRVWGYWDEVEDNVLIKVTTNNWKNKDVECGWKLASEILK